MLCLSNADGIWQSHLQSKAPAGSLCKSEKGLPSAEAVYSVGRPALGKGKEAASLPQLL